MIGAHLPVMRQLRIYFIERSLHTFGGYISGHDCRKVSAAVADDHNLLGTRQALQQHLFDWLRRDVVAGTEDDEILDASRDPPVPCCIHFSLIAGVKPAVA